MGESSEAIPVEFIVDLFQAVGSAIVKIEVDQFNWWTSLFEGVPQDAKTLGAGITLVNSGNPLKQIIGANLIRMASLGHAISEGGGVNGPLSRLVGLGSAVMNLTNQAPPGSLWKPLQVQGDTVSYNLADISPPQGAPYSDPVTIGVFTNQIQPDAAAFTALHGFPPLSQYDLADLFQHKDFPWYDDGTFDTSSNAALFTNLQKLFDGIVTRWAGIQPPGAPDPYLPTLQQIQQCICELEVSVSAYVANSIANPGGGGAGAPVDLTGVTQQLAAIVDRLTSITATDTPAIGAKLDTIGGAIAAASNGPLTDIAAAVKTVAALSSTTAPDPSLAQMATVLQDYWAQQDYPPAEVHQMVLDGLLSSQDEASLQGKIHVKLPPRVAHHIAGVSDAARTLIAKPSMDSLTKLGLAIDKGDGTFSLSDLTNLSKWITDQFGDAFGKFSTAIEEAVRAVPDGTPDIGLARAEAAMAKAFAFGVGAHLVATLGESLPVIGHNGLNTMAALMAEFSGFRAIVEAYHGEFIKQSVRIPSQYTHQATYRPLLPDLGRSLELFARGLISAADRDSLLAQNGFSSQFADVTQTAAYRAPSPMILANLLGETAYDPTAVMNFLTFAAYRPSDIPLVLDQLAARGLKPVRQPILDQVIIMASEGLLDQPAIDGFLTQLDLSDQAKALVNTHITILRTHKLATLFKSELTAAAKEGLISSAQYAQDLANLGYQPAEVSIYKAIIDNRMQSETNKAAAAAISKEQRNGEQIAIRAALEQYRKGKSTDLALATELGSFALTPAQIASYVSLAQVSIEPGFKLGSNLSAFATLQATYALGIKAIAEQYRKDLISEKDAKAAFMSFGLTDAQAQDKIVYIGALKVKAAAAPAPVG